MIQQRDRFRYGVLLAYLLAGGLAHVISRSVALPAPAQIGLTFIFCMVVMTTFGREWWR